MSDVFRSSFRVPLPEGMTMWEATERMTRSAVQLYRRMPGVVSEFSYTLNDESGSKIARDTISGVQEAVREYRLEPDRLWGAAYYRLQDAEHWRNALEVDVHAAFWDASEESIVVRIEGGDKIQVDGMEAHLRREAAHLADDDGADMSEVASGAESNTSAQAQSNVFHGPVNVGVLGNGGSVGSIGNVGPAGSAPSSEPERGFWAWLRRAWRDQTAAFLITVVGTVTAAAVALWLGLAP